MEQSILSERYRQHVDVAHELGNEARIGRRINFLRRADLHEFSVAHHADAVAHHHRLFQRMGDVYEGFLGLAVNVLQFLFQRLPELVVDRRKRFVEEQYLRIIGQGAGERHALAFTTGTFEDILRIIGLRQPQQIHQLQRAQPPLLGRIAANLQGELDILAHRPVREQRQRLEHHAGGALVGGKIVDPYPAEQDVAAGRRIHARQHAQDRRLAGARRPDDGEELTLGNIEIDRIDGGMRPEHLADRFQGQDHGLRHCCCRRQISRPKPRASPRS